MYYILKNMIFIMLRWCICFCVFCCILGCKGRNDGGVCERHDAEESTDSMVSQDERDTLRYDTICIHEPIDIPPYVVLEKGPGMDAQCCDMYAETCCFVEMPTKDFFDSLRVKCMNGTVVLEDDELGYYFDEWTEKGWVKSDDTTRFVYVEPVESNKAVKFYRFKQGEKTFYCYTHYSEELQRRKLEEEQGPGLYIKRRQR